MTSTEITETVKCRRCHRPLTSAGSRSAQIGPRCAAIEAATKGLNAKQAGEALEIAADGGVIPSGHKGVWLVTSGDGESVYRTTPAGQCNCKWGQRTRPGKPCKHVGAVLITIRPRIASRPAAALALAA
jgi:hypothetical protein